MNVLQWLNEHLTFSRRRGEYHDAVSESEELSEVKNLMAQYTRDLDEGHAGKVLHIKRNTMEKVFLGQDKKTT